MLDGAILDFCFKKPTLFYLEQSGQGSFFLNGLSLRLRGAACPLECLFVLLLRVGWPESLKHRVVFGVEGFKLRVLGFSGSSQDGVRKANTM